jgi:pimeloyl-ACP methyl ester carboxylesterase
MAEAPGTARWVAACLHAQGIATVIPDLPSHRDRSAVRADDVAEVQAAIDAAAPPVAVAGWSYGGEIISGLAGTSQISRLVYVGSTRSRPRPRPVPAASLRTWTACPGCCSPMTPPCCWITTGGLARPR